MSLEIAEEMENIWLIQNASWNKVLDKKKILRLFPLHIIHVLEATSGTWMTQGTWLTFGILISIGMTLNDTWTLVPRGEDYCLT